MLPIRQKIVISDGRLKDDVVASKDSDFTGWVVESSLPLTTHLETLFLFAHGCNVGRKVP